MLIEDSSAILVDKSAAIGTAVGKSKSVEMCVGELGRQNILADVKDPG